MGSPSFAFVTSAILHPRRFWYAVRRIRRRTSDIPVLIALLGNTTEAAHTEVSDNWGLVEHSLLGTVEKVLAMARGATKIPESAAARCTAGSCLKGVLFLKARHLSRQRAWFFQVYGIDAEGNVIIRRQLKRRYVLAFFQELPPCLVGIKACASSHHWSRELQALGHTVRLMPPACEA